MKKNISEKIKSNFALLIIIVLLFPIITFAVNNNMTLIDVAAQITIYLTIGIKLIISLAVVTFIWNVYRYFFTEKDKTEAGKYVMYSVIGFFVILSFWGLVAILSNSLNLPTNQPVWPFNNSSNTNPNPNNNNIPSITQ